MVKVKEDMTGWKMWEHGVPDSKWVVIKQTDDYIVPNTGQHYSQWLCQCTCEKQTIKEVTGNHLRRGISKSCGCVKAKISASIGKKSKQYNNYQLNLEDEYGLYGIGFCNNTGAKFYFDMDDYDKIKDYCWSEHIVRNYHALEAKIPDQIRVIRMQWLIVGKFYDHCDRNPLNNRKYNLRPSNDVENARNRTKQSNNTSGFVGVYWHKSKCKWIATININKKQKQIGAFDNKFDAITARLKAEKQHYGEFAPQRHLFKEYGIKDGEGSCSTN